MIGRKNFYGTKTERGADAAAVIYSVIESCRLAEVEPKAYLAYAAHHAIAQRGEPTPRSTHAPPPVQGRQTGRVAGPTPSFGL